MVSRGLAGSINIFHRFFNGGRKGPVRQSAAKTDGIDEGQQKANFTTMQIQLFCDKQTFGRPRMTKRDKAKQKSETNKTKKAKSVLDDIDPFFQFKEWSTIADEKAYEKL